MHVLVPMGGGVDVITELLEILYMASSLNSLRYCITELLEILYMASSLNSLRYCITELLEILYMALLKWMVKFHFQGEATLQQENHLRALEPSTQSLS